MQKYTPKAQGKKRQYNRRVDKKAIMRANHWRHVINELAARGELNNGELEAMLTSAREDVPGVTFSTGIVVTSK